MLPPSLSVLAENSTEQQLRALPPEVKRKIARDLLANPKTRSLAREMQDRAKLRELLRTGS
jgi:hypothetical protein